jgi:hypothetical protein
MRNSFNPKSGEWVQVRRRRVVANRELPEGDSYGAYVHDLITASEAV